MADQWHLDKHNDSINAMSNVRVILNVSESIVK